MSSPDLQGALESAVTAVRRGARMLRRHRYAPLPPSTKHDGSMVTELDRSIERSMREIIHSRHPDHSIAGEECPFEPGSGGWVWYLDPIDGTRVYTEGQDNCCVSAALTRDGVPVAAAVAAPFAGELYRAVQGECSTVNGRPIRVASPRPLAKSEFLLYYDAPDEAHTALMGAFRRRELGRLTQLPGSFILSACRAARGAYDLFLSVKREFGPLSQWDLCPAALVLAGAGGVVQDLEGKSIGGMIPSRETVAGSPESVRELIALAGPRLRKPEKLYHWARQNEAVFARLCSLILGGHCRVIGIAGAGGGIGKSSLARELASLLGETESTIISLDDYLIPRAERDRLDIGAHNPAAMDLERAAADLAVLREGRPCEMPVYDHVRGCRDSTCTVTPGRFLIVEGVHALHPDLCPLVDLSVFLDAEPAARFRRVLRDMEEKGVSESYARAIHERYEEDCRLFLMPLRQTADVVISVEKSFALRWVSAVDS
ncbi:MAG: inositol monophosphatase family protein [Planctomycetota bacterium]|jgi:myo-inositol-1(or 4)-monophosphatase